MQKKIEYKTSIQFDLLVPFFILFASIIAIAKVTISNGRAHSIIWALFLLILGIGPFVSIYVHIAKRNKIRKNGECIPGQIIGSYEMLSSRGISTYYLKVSFCDNGKKIYLTEGYVGDPNNKLADCNCNIYKWKGKYVEGDLNTLNRGEKNAKIYIPSELTYSPVYKISGKVLDA